MARLSGVLLAMAFLVCAVPGQEAVNKDLAGRYKVSFFNQGRMVSIWLMDVELKDKKPTATIKGTMEGLPPKADVEAMTLADGVLSFTLKWQKRDWTFEFKTGDKDSKKLMGNLMLGSQIVPAEMESTKLEELSPYVLNKELIEKNTDPTNVEVINAALDLISQAAEKKATAEDVRKWASRAYKIAEGYGPRWHRDTTMKLASGLVKQKEFAAIAVDYVNKAKAQASKDDVMAQLKILGMLEEAYKNAGKEEDAKQVEKDADALYLAKMPGFKPEKIVRKEKADRVALVELFTGAECPPCVAADLAFDGLEKAYSPTDVVLLQYHLHIPRPDPLSNEATAERQRFYGEEIEGTPTLFVNGKSSGQVGGYFPDAKDRYEDLKKAIEPILEKNAKLKINLKAVKKEDKIMILAETSDLEKPSEKLKLRIALVEDVVQYKGSNGVRYHHRVVRDMPGGAAGIALKEAKVTQNVTVDIKELRAKLNTYLNEFAKETKFPNDLRPMELKKLSVVAFVQNDETQEVLQAAQAEISKKE